MTQELPSIATPVTIEQLANSTLLVWDSTGESPEKRAVELFVAHMAHECGLEKCRCYNLGGAKASPGGKYFWQYFTTREVVSVAKAKAELEAGAPIEIQKTYQRDGVDVASVLVHPRHRWSCFRAFETLEDGTRDHVELIRGKERAWDALKTGDPIVYSRALRAVKYFTGDPDDYTTALIRNLGIVRAVLRDWDGWGNVI